MIHIFSSRQEAIHGAYLDVYADNDDVVRLEHLSFHRKEMITNASFIAYRLDDRSGYMVLKNRNGVTGWFHRKEMEAELSALFD